MNFLSQFVERKKATPIVKPRWPGVAGEDDAHFPAEGLGSAAQLETKSAVEVRDAVDDVGTVRVNIVHTIRERPVTDRDARFRVSRVAELAVMRAGGLDEGDLDGRLVEDGRHIVSRACRTFERDNVVIRRCFRTGLERLVGT